MLYYEAKISICFKKGVPQQEAFQAISNSINSALSLDDELKKLHKENAFKGYCFCLPYPIEAEKIYTAQKVYLFRLRSVNIGFILKIKNLLPKSDEYFKVLSFELYNCSQKYIDKMITLTPACSTMYGRNWVKEDGLEILRLNAHNNAVRKAKLFSNGKFQEPKENFIQCITQINSKAIKIPYKETSIIANKFEIIPKSDDASQELAQVVLGSGLMEKNSIGLGFCIVCK